MVTRKNSWQDAYNTGVAQLDLGDGIVVPLPVDGILPGEPGPAGAGVPTGGAALQVVRKNAAGTTTEWASPDKAMVGLGSVDNTADADKPVSTAQATALGGKVDRGEMVFSVKDFGAVGDGGTDDTAAINAAEQAAFNRNYAQGGSAVVFFPNGRYKITGTVNFRVDVEGTQATLEYYGSGRAVQIGTNSAGVYMNDKELWLPKVICKTAPNGSWDGTSEGVVCINLSQCRIHVPRIETFERGLVVTANGGGTAYSEFFIGALWVNHENLILDQGAAGTAWVNQNVFWGGRITHSTSRGTSDDPTACHIRLGNASGGVLNPPDGNSFYGMSMEGVNTGAGGWARYRIINYGRYTQYFNCRWETSAGVPVIDSREYANDNIVWGGYHANKLSLTGIGGAVKVNDGVEGLVEAVDTTAPVLTTAVDTTLKTWVSPTLSKATYDSTTGLFTPARGRWRIKARVTFPSNATGTRTLRLYAGAVVIDQAIVAGNGNAPVSLVVDKSFKFDGATTFKIVATQTSGADMALTSTSPYTNLQALMAA